MSRASLLLLAHLLIAGVAQAQTPQCRDDAGVDRCDAAQHRRIVEIYGLQPIETHQASGDTVRRVFYVDGFASDMFAISFLRERDSEPRVSVHWPRVNGNLPPPISTPVPENAWTTVIGRSWLIDRELVPVAQSRDGSTTICMHPLLATVEATDAPQLGGQQVPLRRKTDSACGDSLVLLYADELLSQAASRFSYCQDIGFRDCGKLRGDRSAAAGLMKRARDFVFPGIGRQVLQLMFASDAAIEWADTTRFPSRRPEAWIDYVGSGDLFDQPRISLDLVEATAPTAGRVAGTLTTRSRHADAGYETATFEMEWVRVRADGDFIVRRIKVGSFVPGRP